RTFPLFAAAYAKSIIPSGRTVVRRVNSSGSGEMAHAQVAEFPNSPVPTAVSQRWRQSAPRSEIFALAAPSTQPGSLHAAIVGKHSSNPPEPTASPSEASSYAAVNERSG